MDFLCTVGLTLAVLAAKIDVIAVARSELINISKTRILRYLYENPGLKCGITASFM